MVEDQKRSKNRSYHLGFRSVNRRSSANYRHGFQKHHLIPLSMRRYKEFGTLLSIADIRLDNFSYNGLLLPAQEQIALRSGLPLHRGPHPHYSALVAERLFMIWKTAKKQRPYIMAQRLMLMQRALKRTLQSHKALRKPIILNRRDPLNSNVDYSHIDMAIDILWAKTENDFSQ